MSGFMKHVNMTQSLAQTLQDTLIWKCKWFMTGESGHTDCDHVSQIITPDLGPCYTIKPPNTLSNNTNIVPGNEPAMSIHQTYTIKPQIKSNIVPSL